MRRTVRSEQPKRSAASALVYCCSPVAAPLRAFLAFWSKDKWTGTAIELLIKLYNQAGDQATRSRDWPKKPHHLSGKLRRLAPNLRKLGIEIKFGYDGKSRCRIIILRKGKKQ
jgi:hypothetical protein